MWIRMEDLFGARLLQSADVTHQVETEEQRQKLVAQMAKLQTQWNEALDQMQELDPEYVALRRRKPSVWKELRRCLHTM